MHHFKIFRDLSILKDNHDNTINKFTIIKSMLLLQIIGYTIIVNY